MSVVLDSYTNPAASSNETVQGNYTWRIGQSFRVTAAAKLTSASFILKRIGSPGGTAYARLYASSGTFGTTGSSRGSLLHSSSGLAQSSIATSHTETFFTFDGTYTLQPNTDYIMMAEVYSADFTNFMQVRVDNDSPTHPGICFHDVSLRSPQVGPDDGKDTPFSVSGDLLTTADFTVSPTTGPIGTNFSFTDTSGNSPTSWLWTFEPFSTSTSQNPTHTFTTAGQFPVTLQATNPYGTTTKTVIVPVYADVAPDSLETQTITIGSPTFSVSPPPPPPDTDWSALGKEDEKVYVYKVYKSDGTYIGTWDVKDGLEYSQRLNTPGTTTSVLLPRSANNRKEFRETLLTEDGLDVLTTEDGESLIVAYQTASTVGAGTDVDLNYNVDIYVNYGELTDLVTESGELLTTEDGEGLLVTIGAPMGIRVFSGYIIDYESVYGSQEGVTVTLASHGIELSNEVIRSGTTTTVTYSSTALETIAKGIIDTNPGRMSYDANTIGTTGVTETLTFRLNTKLEGIETIYDQTPDGWYWYGNVAENMVYLKPVSATYDHVFTVGKHIKELRVKRTIEDLVNTLYFVGGETTPGDATTTLYKKYEDTTSQTTWRRGLARITDRRYKLTASMQRRADKLIGRYKNPVYTSPLTISSAKYDIESIKLGQTVGFRNFGNFIDGLPPLQIVSLSYSSSAVTVELGELQRSQADIVDDTQDAIANEQYGAIPNAPS